MLARASFELVLGCREGRRGGTFNKALGVDFAWPHVRSGREDFSGCNPPHHEAPKAAAFCKEQGASPAVMQAPPHVALLHVLRQPANDIPVPRNLDFLTQGSTFRKQS